MNGITHNSLSAVDNLLRTLIIIGVLFIASILIANPNSWLMDIAVIASFVGFLSFLLASQFLVSIRMAAENPDIIPTASEKVLNNVLDLRLVAPFIIGHLAYIVAGIFICIYFITK